MSRGPSKTIVSSKKKALILYFTVVVFFFTAWCVYRSAKSSLFLVRVVEVVLPEGETPLSAETVNELAAVPVGKTGLFSLDLADVEKRLLSHPWIEKVDLQKKPPQTLVIGVRFRRPVAIVQQKDGAVAYADRTAKVFGTVNFALRHDLPVFSGVSDENLLKDALNFAEKFDSGSVSAISQLSALSWDPNKGFRASVTYRLKDGNRAGRATLELGSLTQMSENITWRTIDQNLSRVLRYLSGHSISAHQIFVGDGKKIVVKTARGS